MFDAAFLAAIIGFTILALSARQIGDYFARGKLPLISGFLAAGMVVGPYGLGFINEQAVVSLHFVDQLALAFIALAAGNELHLEEVRRRLSSIVWLTLCQLVLIFGLGALAVYTFAPMIPFMANMGEAARLGVALLAGAILVARSPSSAIAIVKELRAKGPFTQSVIGVTVIMDVVVITLFGFASSLADTLILDVSIEVGFLLAIVGELLASVALGLGFGWVLHKVLGLAVGDFFRELLVLLLGFGVYSGCEGCGGLTADLWTIHLSPEPLLICVVAGFWVTNFSPRRAEFSKVCHDAGPPIYVAFFMLAGASLALDVALQVWHICLALFLIRFVALFAGSVVGARASRDSALFGRTYGLAFVTQAGVGLGLAKSVAVAFPSWGPEFATVMVAIIVVNQLLGPPLLKWALHLVKESHDRGEHDDHAGPKRVVVFGLEQRSIALAQQLVRHGWTVKIAERRIAPREEISGSDLDVVNVDGYDRNTLEGLGLKEADSIVVMLSDEENLHVCQLAYEYFGVPQMVARLNGHHLVQEFRAIGVMLVDPQMAIVSMLDHMVRSPLAAAVMLGTEEGQDIIEVEVKDAALAGKLLRELRLPLDTLVLSVSRDGHMLVSHGYTRLHLGDHVTIIGSEESLQQVAVLFEE